MPTTKQEEKSTSIQPFSLKQWQKGKDSKKSFDLTFESNLLTFNGQGELTNFEKLSSQTQTNFLNEIVNQNIEKSFLSSASSNNAAVQYFIQRLINVLSLIFAAGAATKSLIGTEGFIESFIIKQINVAWILSAISAIPPWAFYNDTILGIANKIFRQKNTAKEIENSLKSILPSVFNGHRLFDPLQIILGIGYAAANFGMVLESFPGLLKGLGFFPGTLMTNSEVVLLLCIFITNGCIGVDKSGKVSRDMKNVIGSLISFEEGTPELRLQQERSLSFIKHVGQFEKGGNIFRADSGKGRGDIESGQINGENIQNSPCDIERLLKSTIVRVQESNVTESTSLNENLLRQPLKIEKNVTSLPRYLTIPLAIFSILVSFIAITSNIGGVATCLENTIPIVPSIAWNWIRYLLGTVLSLAAFGLNKDWLDPKLEQIIHPSEEYRIKIHLSPSPEEKVKQNTSNAPHIAYSIIGYVLAFFAAAAGYYFTTQQLEKFNDDHLGIELPSWFIILSSAITMGFMAVTKAQATVEWVKNCCVTYVGAFFSCSKNEKRDPLAPDERNLLKLLDDQITILLKHISECIERISKNSSNWNTVAYVEYLNQELSQQTTRLEIIKILQNEFDCLRYEEESEKTEDKQSIMMSGNNSSEKRMNWKYLTYQSNCSGSNTPGSTTPNLSAATTSNYGSFDEGSSSMPCRSSSSL